MNEFWRAVLGKLVDGRLDLRCANYGCQHGDIMLARRWTSTRRTDGYTAGPYTRRLPMSQTCWRGCRLYPPDGIRGIMRAYQPAQGKKPVRARKNRILGNLDLNALRLLLGLLNWRFS